MKKPVLKPFDQLKTHLKNPGKVVITAHRNPDGDAVGSAAALSLFLTQQGIFNQVIMPNSFPDFLRWLPGAGKMVIFDQQPESAGQLIEEADTIFALDYNAFHRTDRMEESLTRAKAVKIVIDHHPGPDLEAFDIILSETDISATAELLFQFLTTEYGIDAISKPIAEALYVGILTDTGSFRHSCNRPSTFRTVASLIEKGIDVEYISRQVFDTYSASRLRLLGFSLSHRMLVWDELATVVIYLSKEDLKQFHFHEGDTEGLVNYGLSIKKIQVAVLITERKDTIRLSFRSKSNFDVNQFARQYFNGGGHKKAAGGRSETSMENTIQRLKTGLESCKSQLIAL